MISDLLVDLFRVSVVFCRLLVLGFEKFQYTNAKRLVYFHMVAELVWTLE